MFFSNICLVFSSITLPCSRQWDSALKLCSLSFSDKFCLLVGGVFCFVYRGNASAWAGFDEIESPLETTSISGIFSEKKISRNLRNLKTSFCDLTLVVKGRSPFFTGKLSGFLPLQKNTPRSRKGGSFCCSQPWVPNRANKKEGLTVFQDGPPF